MFLGKRDDVVCNQFGECFEVGDSFWYTQTGYIVKWVILLCIFLFFFLWFVGGYLHAQRRMKKGLPPMAYHRWLVPRRQRARFDPPQNHFTFYRPQQSNQNYPEPLPLYNQDAPPQYQPPPGASKVDPAQFSQPQQQEQFSGYAPPPGPPPQQNGVGSYSAPLGAQESGTIGGSGSNGAGAGLTLPERAKTTASGALRFFRK